MALFDSPRGLVHEPFGLDSVVWKAVMSAGGAWCFFFVFHLNGVCHAPGAAFGVGGSKSILHRVSRPLGVFGALEGGSELLDSATLEHFGWETDGC